MKDPQHLVGENMQDGVRANGSFLALVTKPDTVYVLRVKEEALPVHQWPKCAP